MALLTADDVLNKKFQSTKFREGYDQDEVDDFLDEVVNTLREVQNENDDLKTKLAAAERRIAELSRGGAPASAPEPVVVATPPAPEPAPEPVASAPVVAPAAPAPAPARRDAYPGDYDGVVATEYAPDPDGEPDPGEIVWAWVPYEEDHTRGKDRPLLVVGRDGPWLLGLALTSRDHDARPGRPGEVWVDLGTGTWDARRRPSEVRVDRVVRVRPDAVRREGAVLDRERFDAVAGSLRRLRGW